MRGAESLGPKTYTLKRERGRRRMGACITRHLGGITRPTEKGAVGAPRALMCYEGRGSFGPKITLSKGKGPSAEGGMDYRRHRENYTIRRERGRRRAACFYLLRGCRNRSAPKFRTIGRERAVGGRGLEYPPPRENYTPEREWGRRRRAADLLDPKRKLRARKRRGRRCAARFLSPLRDADSIGPKNYAIKRERGSRRKGAWITRRLEAITRSKEKWAVGAPSAPI